MNLNPFIKPKNNTVRAVMLDVIIALLPLAVVACIAYGVIALWLILTAIASCVVTDFLFNAVYAKNYTSFLDGSAIITALLLCFTLSPLTPWYVVAFGSFSAILFGKFLWGGLGKNKFNPALVGREFMVAFFTVMSSATVWVTNSMVNTKQSDLLSTGSLLANYGNNLLYKTGGALGEYSVALIFSGGLYLLIRRRISWHIPFALLTTFLFCTWLAYFYGVDFKYSSAGLLLGGLFMATDMPSSPNASQGRLYYGCIIGLVAAMFILSGIRFEYLSYSILLLNGFTPFINQIFMPRAWGKKPDYTVKAERIFFLTTAIFAMAFAVISLHYYGLIKYVVYVYIVYIILKFNFSFLKNIHNPI